MPPTDEIDDHLTEQLSAFVDGRLTAAEVEALEARLLADPAGLAVYCEFMDKEFLLAWELKCRASDPSFITAFESSSLLRPAPRGWGSRRFLRASIILLPLVAVAAAFVAGRFGRIPSPALGDGAAAILSRAEAARWNGLPILTPGQPLPAGRLSLQEGRAQLTFASGAVVGVQAPAEFEVLGRNRLLLRHGQMIPFVPPQAKGFTVVSPSGDVIDLGTEFSISVGADGKTDVFVIDGEVDVAGSQFADPEPMRLTQGYAGRLSGGGQTRRITQEPVFVERFDATSPLFRAIEPEPDWPPLIRQSELRIPLDGRLHRTDPTVQVLIDRDFTALVGRKSTISYKISLPSGKGLPVQRWAGLAIDSGDGPLAWAHKPGASAGILVSPLWQVGFYVSGKKALQADVWQRNTVFPRGSEAVGPYQVVVTIDDTPATRERLGRAGLSAIVNGVEFLRDYPIELGNHPRMAFQTFLPRDFRGVDADNGCAIIDDLSVSVDIDPAGGPS